MEESLRRCERGLLATVRVMRLLLPPEGLGSGASDRAPSSIEPGPPAVLAAGRGDGADVQAEV